MTETQHAMDPIVIESHTGPYTACFDDDALGRLDATVPDKAHFIVDARVVELYREQMSNILAAPSVTLIPATEINKSLDRMPEYVEVLVTNGVRRDHTLIAIGGGIIQDITCFLAATLLRGVDWHLYPTTLLAQADSCIGSKSSINAGHAKNIVGMFKPPREVHVSTRFLDTLDDADIRSGVGEMLKVHAIAGPGEFARIAGDYDRILADRATMMGYIRRSLEIKKPYIEEDEFDRGPRNIFNYGHSFGHAIEAATEFGVPHGIGVTIGMDMANFVAAGIGFGDERLFRERHGVLKRNFREFERHPVPLKPFLSAIGKDKKNIGAELMLILPDDSGALHKTGCANDERFMQLCQQYLEDERAR